ncbi:MAG TPA: hypothetical protein VK509_06115, partial [Polyangiales bacterium]|nr:hypothetical protein [Polyangiales bacterium]
APEQADRFATMQEFADALARALDASDAPVRPTTIEARLGIPGLALLACAFVPSANLSATHVPRAARASASAPTHVRIGPPLERVFSASPVVVAAKPLPSVETTGQRSHAALLAPLARGEKPRVQRRARARVRAANLIAPAELAPAEAPGGEWRLLRADFE